MCQGHIGLDIASCTKQRCCVASHCWMCEEEKVEKNEASDFSMLVGANPLGLIRASAMENG